MTAELHAIDRCPIHIADNAIIPLKERVVDRFDEPVTRPLRMVTC